MVPFLVELRAVMDWVWTDTTLSLSNWMCVEDIYANIFIIKCSRETEKVGRHINVCVLIRVLHILADSLNYPVKGAGKNINAHFVFCLCKIVPSDQNMCN